MKCSTQVKIWANPGVVMTVRMEVIGEKILIDDEEVKMFLNEKGLCFRVVDGRTVYLIDLPFVPFGLVA